MEQRETCTTDDNWAKVGFGNSKRLSKQAGAARAGLLVGINYKLANALGTSAARSTQKELAVAAVSEQSGWTLSEGLDTTQQPYCSHLGSRYATHLTKCVFWLCARCCACWQPPFALATPDRFLITIEVRSLLLPLPSHYSGQHQRCCA